MTDRAESSRGDLEGIGSGLAAQFAELYGARPIDPQAFFAGEMLRFAFQGGLSRCDELLLENGRSEDLREFREAFLNAVSDRLSRAVEGLTGARVTFFIAAFDPDSRTTNAFFALRQPG